jgi:hypothetical protein
MLQETVDPRGSVPPFNATAVPSFGLAGVAGLQGRRENAEGYVVNIPSYILMRWGTYVVRRSTAHVQKT